MSRRFAIGDKVRVKCAGSSYDGEECAVISQAIFGVMDDEIMGVTKNCWFYHVDLPQPATETCHLAFEPHELIPLYDGRELVSWESCLWKAAGVGA